MVGDVGCDDSGDETLLRIGDPGSVKPLSSDEDPTPLDPAPRECRPRAEFADAADLPYVESSPVRSNPEPLSDKLCL